MKLFNKKNLAVLAIGGLLAAGIAAPLAAQAAESPNAPRFEHRIGDGGKMMQEFAAQFNISESDLQAYREKGISPRDLGHAAMLSKISGKPINDILNAKTLNTSWKELSQSLGVTPEQMKAARADMIAGRLETKLNISKQTTLDLLNQDYQIRDIAVAGKLSATSGKPIQAVLDLKKINNSWKDVASTLGISDEAFKQDMQTLRQAMPMGGHGHGPQMMNAR